MVTHPLDALLLGRAAPGRWSIGTLPNNVESHVASFGWQPILIEQPNPDEPTLDKTAPLDKAAFLAEAARAASFPDWVGSNWDAFEDAMGDLSWIQDRPVIVIVATAVPALAVEILSDAAAAWERRGRRFAILDTSLDSDWPSLDELDELLRDHQGG